MPPKCVPELSDVSLKFTIKFQWTRDLFFWGCTFQVCQTGIIKCHLFIWGGDETWCLKCMVDSDNFQKKLGNTKVGVGVIFHDSWTKNVQFKISEAPKMWIFMYSWNGLPGDGVDWIQVSTVDGWNGATVDRYIGHPIIYMGFSTIQTGGWPWDFWTINSTRGGWIEFF